MKIPPTALIAFILLCASCTPGYDPATFQANLEAKTGLKVEQVDSNTGLMSKTHRGYPLMMRISMGDVWGRYGARMAASQVAPLILGRVGRFLTGTYESGVGSIVGSPFDRVLSSAIGQPISLFAVLKH